MTVYAIANTIYCQISYANLIILLFGPPAFKGQMRDKTLTMLFESSLYCLRVVPVGHVLSS